MFLRFNFLWNHAINTITRSSIVRNTFQQPQAFRTMPWAWALAWGLTSVGASLADIYSSPNNGLFYYLLFSVIGWSAAVIITVHASNNMRSIKSSLAGWIAAYLVAIPLGLAWMISMDMAPFLLFIPYFFGGFFGGAASSNRPGSGRWLSATLLGLVFYVFATISFYAGFLLMYYCMSLAYQYHLVPLYTQVWVLPYTLFGLVIGFLMRWILGFKAVQTKTVED